jgi:serine kinase of HPr protein (carbohydrate metabolism regulator)
VKETIHATCLEIAGHGVLLIGPPGSGKSDLALRLIDASGRGTGTRQMEAVLVSDDQTVVTRENGHLLASPPDALAGKIEVRGLGILACRHRKSTRLALSVRLTAADTVDRMPEAKKNRFDLLGVKLPLVLIDPQSASAPARVRTALLGLSP